jgi:hypothetical protein
LLAEVRFYAGLNALAHAPHHGNLLRVGRKRALGDDLAVLRGSQGVDFAVAHEAELTATRDGHRRASAHERERRQQEIFFSMMLR